MCRVGVVHALVDLLGPSGGVSGGTAEDVPAGVTALAVLRVLAATPDNGSRRHVETAVGACPGLSMDALRCRAES